MSNKRSLRAIFFDLGETIFTYGDVDVNVLFAAGAQGTYDYLSKIANDIGDNRAGNVNNDDNSDTDTDDNGTDNDKAGTNGNTGSKVTGGGRLPSRRYYYLTHIASIKLHYILSNITKREFDCMALLSKKARRMGFVLSQEQLRELAWLWYKPLSDVARVEDDLHATLRQLQDMSLRMAIISNTFLPAAVLDRHLQQYDLLQYFPVRIYSSQTIYRKPDRRIYQYALQQVGVTAEQTLMVGDRLREDIRGSTQLGMNAVMKQAFTNVKTRCKARLAGISVIDRLSELPGLIKKQYVKQV